MPLMPQQNQEFDVSSMANNRFLMYLAQQMLQGQLGPMQQDLLGQGNQADPRIGQIYDGQGNIVNDTNRTVLDPARGSIRQSDANMRANSGKGYNSLGGPGLDGPGGFYDNNPHFAPGEYDPTGAKSAARRGAMTANNDAQTELVGNELGVKNAILKQILGIVQGGGLGGQQQQQGQGIDPGFGMEGVLPPNVAAPQEPGQVQVPFAPPGGQVLAGQDMLAPPQQMGPPAWAGNQQVGGQQQPQASQGQAPSMPFGSQPATSDWQGRVPGEQRIPINTIPGWDYKQPTTGTSASETPEMDRLGGPPKQGTPMGWDDFGPSGIALGPGAQQQPQTEFSGLIPGWGQMIGNTAKAGFDFLRNAPQAAGMALFGSKPNFKFNNYQLPFTNRSMNPNKVLGLQGK